MFIDGVYDPPAFAFTPITGLVDDDSASSIIITTGTVTGEATVAFPAIRKAVLSTSQIASLAKGLEPIGIQPQSLVSYARLSGGIYSDMKGGSFTVTGSVSPAPNPRIFHPLGGRRRGGY
jgi:hypothetical protein